MSVSECDDQGKCEMCGTVTDELICCDECGSMVCVDCTAATAEDEDRGEICEECF